MGAWMKVSLSNLATERYRWLALVFLASGLAIVIIDNTVLNVAVPYILRDLHTTLDAMQWVISGYALIIATLLITMGRLGDLVGRRRVFRIGVVLFAIGSFIASISQSAGVLFLGEAFIEAIGASMMLTSTLSLLASQFQGRERAIAFGVWGSVAGASAAFGPLLGGYLTTFYSWRWSLRINVFVAVIALLGSVVIKESKGRGGQRFDWLGTVFSGIGLAGLVFALIEGRRFGWLTPNEPFVIDGWSWPFTAFSVIPVAFVVAAVFLGLFIATEYIIARRGGSPLLDLRLFKSRGFTLGLVTLGIVILGQFGVFFVMPIYLQNALGLTAFQTGRIILSSSISAFIFGPLSGIIASRIGPKWVVTTGMLMLFVGAYVLRQSISVTATGESLAPGFAFFGIGIGMTSAQLTNSILSSVSVQYAGEASATNATVRQIGTSIGVAVIGAVLATTLTTGITDRIQADPSIPSAAKGAIVSTLNNVTIESGATGALPKNLPPPISTAIKNDINRAFVDATRRALGVGLVFILAGGLFSLLIPPIKQTELTKERPQRETRAA